MPALRCDLWWSATHHTTLKVDSAQLVGELVAEIQYRLGAQLPEHTAERGALEYMLYRAVPGGHEPIFARGRTLAQAQIVDGATLYFAARGAPWWAVATPRPALPLCSVQPHCGARAVVPPAGLELSRAYLLRSLPQIVVTRERAHSSARHPSRLLAVSRQTHCRIVALDSAWQLHASAVTFVDGRRIEPATTAPLTGSVVLLLGRDGWPVDVHVAAAAHS